MSHRLHLWLEPFTERAVEVISIDLAKSDDHPEGLVSLCVLYELCSQPARSRKTQPDMSRLRGEKSFRLCLHQTDLHQAGLSYAVSGNTDVFGMFMLDLLWHARVAKCPIPDQLLVTVSQSQERSWEIECRAPMLYCCDSHSQSCLQVAWLDWNGH